jgi:hypothetical protein
LPRPSRRSALVIGADAASSRRSVRPLRLPRPDTPDQVRISDELRIGCVESCGLDDRLRDENAVERIAVRSNGEFYNAEKG